MLTLKRLLTTVSLLWLAGVLIYVAAAWLLPRDPVLGKWYPGGTDTGSMNFTEFRLDGTLAGAMGDKAEGTWRPVEAWYVSSPSRNSWITHEFFLETPPANAQRCRHAYLVELHKPGKVTMIVAVSRDGRFLVSDFGHIWGRCDTLLYWLRGSVRSWSRGKEPWPRDRIGLEHLSDQPEEL